MLKTAVFSLSLLAGVAGVSAPKLMAQAQSYTIDPAHSQVDFAIKHMAISTVHGRLAIKSGTIVYDPSDASKSKVEATLDVTSVDTGQPQRDKHLNSPDFFDTAKYPTATFKSTSVKKAGDGLDVFGDLEMHGVSKPVTLHMEMPSKAQKGMDGKEHRGFSATTQIDRKNWGLTWNGTLKDSGDAMLGDDVKLTLDIEAAAAK